MATLAQEQAMLQLSAPTPRALSPMELMAQVLQTQNPKDAVEVVKELAKLQMEMRRQDAEEGFNIAFSQCQKEIRAVVKDEQAEIKGKQRTWATFDALDAEVRPIYSRVGYDFALSWTTENSDIPDQMIVVAFLSRGLHTRRYQLPMDISGKGPAGGDVMAKPQAIGSGLSFGKRYLLAAIWNIPIRDGIEGFSNEDLANDVRAIGTAFDRSTLWKLYNAAADKYEKIPSALKTLNEVKRKRSQELEKK